MAKLYYTKQSIATTGNFTHENDLTSKGTPYITSPSSFVQDLLPGRNRIRTLYNSHHKYTPSLEQQQAYSVDAVQAVRSNNITALREILNRTQSMDGCNGNGETLLHLACRRSNSDTIKFLLYEAHVPIRTDSMGRTPLHDLCWRGKPDFDTFAVFIHLVVPDTLLAEDMRGHNCFDYCRKADWYQWNVFLEQYADTIIQRAKSFDSICL